MQLLIVVLFVVFTTNQAKNLPDYLTPLLCAKSNPDFDKCIQTNFRKGLPLMLKGIPEVNLPPLEPFEMPLMTVDRSINDLVSIKAVLRNVKVTGGKDAIIDSFKNNLDNLSGELRVTFPWIHLEMEYDVDGQLLVIPLKSRGFFNGNFTDTQIYVKGNLKTIARDGEEYYRVDKLHFKGTVGDGHIQLTAANPDLQFGADLIANFFNENPRRVMDAVNPIFAETSAELFRIVIDQILTSVPANQWLPE